MSARLPGPGPQLSTGRIRVDAGKAIAKLREYQLTDRSLWILEAIRAAVASHAKHITLTGDANDIWLSWEGTPWDIELLPRLFDELVSPSAGVETQHVRLLAAAVNSALGMNPAYIDVIRVADDGSHVARYKPDVLAERKDDLEESKLEQIAVESTKRPPNAPIGMTVHLRRRISLEVLTNFFTRPPELAAAEHACRDIVVPLTLPDCEMHRDTSPDVLRLPLGEGVDGFIAVTDKVIGEPELQVAEHGVVLARYVHEINVDADIAHNSPLPVRIFVDAPRMPTNASRSQVRRDKHPISTAEKAANKLIPDLLGRLAKLVSEGNERARASALAWIAGRVGGAQWHVDVAGIRGPLREVAKLPLVRNAVGEPRALAQHWRPEIYTGKSPLPTELGAWLGDMMWMPPGDPARSLLLGSRVDERATRRLIRWAKRQAAAQRKFYSHAKRDTKVVAERKARVRSKLGADVPESCVDAARFNNMTGELCIYTEGNGGSLVVLLEGRELDRISITCPIPFEAVVDSPHVRPADRYRGVERDSHYTRVERAVLGGVIRAVEALALSDPPSGYELEASASKAEDARLFVQSFAVLAANGIKLKGPLGKAKCWTTLDGKWVSPEDLKGQAIGVVSPGVDLTPPKNRIIVVASDLDRNLLADFARDKLVNYDRAAGLFVPPDDKQHAKVLAGELANGRPCALAIVEKGLVGAIAPANKATVQLRHAGRKLQTQSRKSRYLSSVIVVSSDDIVPDTDWKSAATDIGLVGRDYGSWELALVRAMARAVAGELAPELQVPGVISIDGPMGSLLCQALAEGDPHMMLGDELIAELRKAKLVRLHGQRERITIDELSKMYPDSSIPLIVNDVAPVRGFSPVHTPLLVGQAIAKLAGRKCHDASSELIRRAARVQFEERLAEHAALPQDRVPLPIKDQVEVTGSYTRGEIAVAESDSWVKVYVENRLFTELKVPFSLPLVAMMDLAAEHCGDTFEQIPLPVASKILDDIVRAVPRLLVTVGKAHPERLSAVGPARQLLAWASKDLGAEARRQLCAIPAFRTVKGTLISLEAASEPRGMIRTAAWQEEWLGPEEGKPEDSLDEPILMLTSDAELRTVIEKVSDKPVVDETEDVMRLQANRRMARGLIPTPKVVGVPPELKRPLTELGDAGAKLGHGELALIDGDQSLIHLHSQGRFVRTIPFNVSPPVALAIEDHEIAKPDQLRDIQKLVDEFLGEHPLTATVHTLAIELVKQILATPARSLLTPRMLRNLARSVWSHKISPRHLGDLAVFETIEHQWVPWAKLEEQIDEFEDVWAVTEWVDERPLDPKRLVLLATKEDIENTAQHKMKLIDARKELQLDALAKRNRAMPLATSLALSTQLGVFATGMLDGDGTKETRGTIAVLLPSIVGNRGVHVHQAMHPLGTMDDPCAWPTLAVIDDARLTPDRTWSKPKADQAWQAVTKAIRTASERLLETVGEAPSDALESLRVDAGMSGEIREARKTKSQVRGALWLEALPSVPTTIHLTHNLGVTALRTLPVSGQLLLYAEGSFDKEEAIEELAAMAHGKLVRRLVSGATDKQNAAIQAHVAHALALENVKPTEVRAVELGCFAPSPLEPRAFVALLRRHHAVFLVQPGDPVTEVSVVDDGSPVSKVVMLHLAKRLRAPLPVVAPSAAPPQPVKVAVPEDDAPPKRAPEPTPEPAKPPPPKKKKPAPEPPHPLQGLVERVSKRVAELGLRGYEYRISEKTKHPMCEFKYGYMFVAGDNDRLRALATQLATASPWVPTAIDALAAHVISLLNIALTEVTDSTESDALQRLLINRRSEDPPQSHQSS